MPVLASTALTSCCLKLPLSHRGKVIVEFFIEEDEVQILDASSMLCTCLQSDLQSVPHGRAQSTSP